jgi:hypothetical protein
VSVSYTHALSARKVEVNNAVAELTAAGSSLDRQKSRQFVPHSNAAGMSSVGTDARPELHIPTSQLKRE